MLLMLVFLLLSNRRPHSHRREFYVQNGLLRFAIGIAVRDFMRASGLNTLHHRWSYRRPRQDGRRNCEPRNGCPGRVDLAFESGGSLELVPRPEFCSRQTERQTLWRESQTGMHQ